MNVLGDITGRKTVQLTAVGDTEFVYYVASAPKQEVSSEEALSGPDSNAWTAAVRAKLLSIIQEHHVFSVELMPVANKLLSLKWVLNARAQMEERRGGSVCEDFDRDLESTLIRLSPQSQT